MTQDHDGILSRLKSILLEDLEVNIDASRITGDVPLMEGGLDLDSVAVVELIGAIEERFDIELDDEDLRPATFENLNAVARVIGKHKHKVRKHQLSLYGPSDRLLGFITVATAEATGIGAVLWGTGVLQLRIARQLAKRGVPSLHTKLADRDRGEKHYSHDGIVLCRAAMDRLAASEKVESFILIANCAFANISLNTALIDTRVRALILTNPYLTKEQKRELDRWSSVKRVLRINRWRRLYDRVAGLVAGRDLPAPPTGPSKLRPATRAPRPVVGKDMLLPAQLDKRLRELCDRGVEIYYACSSTELGIRYMRKHYSRALGDLQRRGVLRLEAIDTDVHLWASDHPGVHLHGDAILRWMSSKPGLTRNSISAADASSWR